MLCFKCKVSADTDGVFKQDSQVEYVICDPFLALNLVWSSENISPTKGLGLLKVTFNVTFLDCTSKHGQLALFYLCSVFLKKISCWVLIGLILVDLPCFFKQVPST